MLKKTITYVDYDGNERTEDFYFNLNKAELTEMRLSVEGGLDAYIQKIVAAKDEKTIFSIFKDIIHKAYGEKSLDGRRFIKSKELSDGFMQTEAYPVLLEELGTNSEMASEFVKGIMPSK